MKPRCQGHHGGGAHTSFLCVLDEGHDGFCEPYKAPDVDEWRAMKAREAELCDIVALWRTRGMEARRELAASEAAARLYAGRTASIEEACRADVARLQAELEIERATIWRNSLLRIAKTVGVNNLSAAPDAVQALADACARLQAENDALRAIIESGKDAP